MHRARERHVDQAQGFGSGLDGQLLLDGAVRVDRLVEVGVEVDHGLVVIVVVLLAIEAAGKTCRASVPQRRAEHDRVLQALGLVHGDDLHQIAVGLEPQLRGLVAAALRALVLQPAQQRFGRGVAARALRGFVQTLAQVQQVGHAPLAVGARQQPLAHLFLDHPAPEHHAHTALEPQISVLGAALDQREQLQLVARDRLDGRRIAPQQLGGQGRAQQALAGGLEDGGQHSGEFFGVVAGKHAGLRQLHAAHAQRSQCVAHLAAVGVAAHQHRDVAGRKRAATERDVPLLRRADQPGDLAGADFHRGASGLRLWQRLATVVLRQRPQLQRRAGFGGIDQRLALLGTEAHLLVGQARTHEGAVVAPEQRVQAVQQRLGRALVFAQRVNLRRTRARLQVGRQVGIAKTVDRLLGVAHQKQRRAAVAVKRVEHRELQRVGVLKLVDQRGREACFQRRGQPWAFTGCQPFVQVVEHVVEGHHATVALEPAQRGGAVGEQGAQQTQAVEIE